MKRIFLLLLVLSAVAARAADANADTAWQRLEAVIAKRVVAPSGPLDENNPPKSLLILEVERCQELAAEAKAFATTFPNDARATAAKRIEVTAGLQAVQLGAEQHKSKAVTAARAFRDNKAHAAKDRFEVALMMETVAESAALHGKSQRKDGTTYEKIANTLHQEFGDDEAVFHLYLEIIRTSDTATAVRLAKKVAQIKGAPAWAKEQAQSVLDRDALLQKPVNLKLTALSGATVDLKKTDKPTVLVLWNASEGSPDLTAVKSAKSQLPSGFDWVYVAIGAKAPATADTASLAGTHCFTASTQSAELVSTLKVQQLPCVYVLDAKGKLTGFGSIADLSELMAAKL